MNAFQQAIADLMADPNIGRAATYRPTSGGTQSLRVTLLAPDRMVDIGTMGAVMPAAIARIAVADVSAQPQEGDGLVIGATYYEITMSRLDSQGVSWLAHLRDLPEQSARGILVRHSAR